MSMHKQRRTGQRYLPSAALLLGILLGVYGAFVWVREGSATAGGMLRTIQTNTLAASLPAAASCSSPSFGTVTNYPVGSVPVSVAVSDFNRDGKLDLATSNNGSDNVSMLLGNGSGGFAPAVNFSVGSVPTSLKVADFNSDSNPDIATSNANANTVSVLLGNGSGGFAPAVDFPVSTYPISVATGDFNKDGNIDLTTANYVSNSVAVLLGNGSGGFGSAVSFTVGSNPESAAVADFNSDSNPDIVVAEHGGNDVAVLLGNGSGGFSTASYFPVGTGANSVAVGDFNEDGHPDLAVVNANYPSDSISVLLGTGGGGFDPAIDYPLGGPSAVAVADFNADGHADLGVANQTSNNVYDLSVLLGTGTGNFGAATDFPVDATPWSVGVGDFNGDGSPDVATANYNPNTVSVLLNSCISTTPSPTNTPIHTATGTPTPIHTNTPLPSNTPTNTITPLPTQTQGGGTATPTETTVPPTSTPPLTTATATPVQFGDVPPGSTFYPYIECLVSRGIINGYPCGGPGEPCDPNNDPYFRPGNNVTRGQFAKIASNSAGFIDPPGAQQYEDVLPGSTYFDFVWRLSDRGLVNGYPCGGVGEPCGPNNLPYFRPNSNITRGQIAKIDSNAAGYSDTPGAQQYEDVLPGSTFYDFIWRLSDRGLVNGYPCGGIGEPCGPSNLPYFRPSANATRGQASKIVSNTFFPACNVMIR
jgi:hypothetical protein